MEILIASFVILLVIEIIVGIKTRKMMSGRALLYLAGLQVITPFIAYAVAVNPNDSSGLYGLIWFIYTYLAEGILCFIAFIIMIVIFTGLMTKRLKRISN